MLPRGPLGKNNSATFASTKVLTIRTPPNRRRCSTSPNSIPRTAGALTPMAETLSSLADLAGYGRLRRRSEAPVRVQKLDKYGRAYATGKRKNAVAREILIKRLTVDGRETPARLDPDPRHRVLAFSGRVAAPVPVQLPGRGRGLPADGPEAEPARTAKRKGSSAMMSALRPFLGLSLATSKGVGVLGGVRVVGTL